ncbi:2Fe-2S iron-sulfur cluster-binding protein [Gorillibacterium sp. sgz5001074]|uniref:2Fe-2S iron-sulfur cluster-binding protein n=1 Tax=Gorillibacterium sp. sgz5001074 TaxID=3446695 RepID=UPI003F675419
MLELEGRTVAKTVNAAVGTTLLDAALSHGVDVGFSCSRGTCGRCRCFIEDGMEHLTRVTDEEWERLTDDELESGYRLACQAAIKSEGNVKAVHRPYY